MGVDKYESKRFWCLLLYCALGAMWIRWKWVLVIQVQYAVDQNRIARSHYVASSRQFRQIV